jgi:tubulin-folding cofactor B
MTTTADVPLLIISENARSERRISPAWTIAQLKGRLEPITGVPASSQRLTLKVASWPDQNLQTVNEENTQLGAFTLQSYAELHVSSRFDCSTTCTKTSSHDSYMVHLSTVRTTAR